jgi:hypothetical protein
MPKNYISQNLLILYIWSPVIVSKGYSLTNYQNNILLPLLSENKYSKSDLVVCMDVKLLLCLHFATFMINSVTFSAPLSSGY